MRIPLVLATGFMARRLGSSDYGEWAVVIAFQGLVFSVASLGLSTALSRYAASVTAGRALGMLLAALGSCLVTVAALGLPIFGFSATVAVLLGLPSAATALIEYGLLIVVAQVAESLLDAYFKARELVGRQACFQIIRAATDVIAIIVAFSRISPSAPEHHFSAILTYVAIAAAGKAILYPLLLIGMKGGVEFPHAPTQRDMLRIGLPLIPASILLALIYQEDRLILGHFVESDVLGVYALAAALAMYLHAVGTLAYTMLLPRLSRYYDQESRDEVGNLIDLSQRLFLDLMGPVLVCLALLGTDIVVLVAGASYAAAGPLLLILGLGVAIDRLFGPYELVFYLVKRSYWVTGINALSCVTVAIGIVWGVRLADVSGAACGIVAAIVCNNLLRACAARRFMRLAPSHSLWRAMLFILAAVALTAALADHLDLPGRVVLTVPGIIYATRTLIRTFLGDNEPVHTTV